MSKLLGRSGVFGPSFDPTWGVPNCKVALYSDLGITKDGSNRIGTWADQSGNGNDALQLTDSKKPIWYPSSVGMFNNYPVSLFDGIDDIMQTAAFSSPLIQPTSIFVVGRFTDFDYYPMVVGGLAFPNLHTIFGLSPDGELYMYAGIDLGPGLSPNYSPFVISTLFNGASSELWLNGSSVLSGNVGAVSMAGLSLGNQLAGGLYDFGGNIVALLVYNPGLSNTSRLIVQNGLLTRYAI